MTTTEKTDQFARRLAYLTITQVMPLALRDAGLADAAQACELASDLASAKTAAAGAARAAAGTTASLSAAYAHTAAFAGHRGGSFADPVRSAANAARYAGYSALFARLVEQAKAEVG